MPLSDQNIKKRHAFALSIFKKDFSNYVDKRYLEGFVNALFRYFSGDLSENDFGFFNNGKVTSDSFSKLTNSLNYICKCLKEIKNLPFDIIKSARNLNSLIRTKSVETGVFDNSFYELLFSSLDVINITIKITPDDRRKTFTNETFIVYLRNEVVDFGKIILTLRNDDRPIEKIEGDTVGLIQSAITNKYLNLVQATNLRYAFFHEYHFGNDIINKCNELFKTDSCYSPEVTDLYTNISNGHFSSGVNNLNKIISLLGDDNLTTLCKGSNNIPIVNFLQYLKIHVENLNKNKNMFGIPEDFLNLNKTSLFINKLSQFLIDKDIKKTKIYGDILSFVTEVLKDPHLSMHDISLFTPAINICNDFIKHLFKEKNINPTVKLYANIYRQINEIKLVNFEYRLSFASVLKDLMLNCLEQPNCDANFTLNEFLDVFGHIIKSNIHVPSDKNITEIENLSIEVFKKAQTKLGEAELLSIAKSFLSPYVQKTDISVKCNSLFNLTNCQEFIPANQTDMQDIDMTTIKPETTTNQTITTAATTIPAVPISVNKTINPVNTTTQTAIDTVNTQDFDALSPGSIRVLSASAAHGVGSGMINGIIHYFATKYSRHGEHSSKAKTVAICSSLLAHAAFSATFPIMLFEIQQHLNQGNEDEAQQLWDVLLKNALPTFITSVVTNCGYHLACELSQSFSNRFRTLAQNIPLLATVCNLHSNPLETGVQLGASFAASSLTYFGLNRLSPIKNRQSSDIETFNTKETYDVHNNEVEMQSLNNKKINGVKKSGDDGFEYSIKTYQYITPEKFDEVKKCSEELLNKLTEVEASLSESITNNNNAITSKIPPAVAETYETIINAKSHVLEIITEQTTSMDECVKHLNDKIHHDADKYHNDKKLYNEAMEKLGNVFKLMVPMLNTMKAELNGAKGYIDGKKVNFAEIPNISTKIDNIMDYIPIPLSLYNIYLKKYSDSEMLERAEKNGAKKALQNHERFNSTATNFRQPNNRNMSNRVCSMYSDRTRSSGSDISGNSEFDPLVEQQQRDLISP